MNVFNTAATATPTTTANNNMKTVHISSVLAMGCKTQAADHKTSFDLIADK